MILIMRFRDFRRQSTLRHFYKHLLASFSTYLQLSNNLNGDEKEIESPTLDQAQIEPIFWCNEHYGNFPIHPPSRGPKRQLFSQGVNRQLNQLRNLKQHRLIIASIWSLVINQFSRYTLLLKLLQLTLIRTLTRGKKTKLVKPTAVKLQQLVWSQLPE